MEDGSHIRYLLTSGTGLITQTDSPVLVDLLILIILVLVHAFFSASEIAIITLNDHQMNRDANEGDQHARRMIKLLKEPSRFLATIQVGVTLAGFLAAAFAADKFTTRLYALIQLDLPAVRTLTMIAVTIILVYFSLVFGELLPKRIAQHKPEKIARYFVSVLFATGYLLRPFVWLVTATSNTVLRIFKIDPRQTNRQVTEEEIRMMVDVGRESGAIHAAEKELIENIFEFNDKDVAEIMTHRTNIVSLDVQADYAEVLETAIHEKYTRIPVYEENLDNIVGILHIKDLLYHAAEGLKQPFSLRDMIRPPYFVPESKHIDILFREMQFDRIQMAVVVDEYGGTAGIVTIEDLLEEIVGNIQDEYDEEEQEIVQKSPGTFLLLGTTPLHEVAEIVSIDFPDDDYDTIAGLVISLLGRIPDDHEYPEVTYENLVLKVIEMDEKRVSKVQMTILPHQDPIDEDDL